MEHEYFDEGIFHTRTLTWSFSFWNVYSISSLPRAKSIHPRCHNPRRTRNNIPRQNSTSTIYIHRALKLRSPQGPDIFDDQKRPLFKIPCRISLSFSFYLSRCETKTRRLEFTLQFLGTKKIHTGGETWRDQEITDRQFTKFTVYSTKIQLWKLISIKV